MTPSRLPQMQSDLEEEQEEAPPASPKFKSDLGEEQEKRLDQEKHKGLIVKMVREKCRTKEIAIMNYRDEAISTWH